MLFINLEFKQAASSVVSDVLHVLKKLELLALFISCMILGKFLCLSNTEVFKIHSESHLYCSVVSNRNKLLLKLRFS